MKYRKLREHLAKLAGNPIEIVKAMPDALRASTARAELAVRAAGGTDSITKEQRDQLLQDAAAGKYVELEVDILAYEQMAGQRNRNSVRFRDGAMMSLGRSGANTPFLRDHNQYNVMAAGGTITASSTDKRGEGDYAIRQTSKVTAPWAVDLVLRDLVHAVSIGWRPTGPVMCSACDEPIFTVCWHFPGDDLSEREAAALKVDPSTIVEWVYSDAELKETSMLSIGGVPNARIDGVRASLSAYLGEHHPHLRPDISASEGNFRFGDTPEETSDMDKELLKLLGLAETATPSEVLAAVQKIQNAQATDQADLVIKNTELAKHSTAIAALQADKNKREQDTFIATALATGRIAPGDATPWRTLYELDSTRAIAQMAERPANSSTPVGAPRASENDPEKKTVITGGERRMSKVKKALAALTEQLAANRAAANFAINAFGFSDPLNRLHNVPETLGSTTITNSGVLDSAKIGFHAAFLEQLDDKPEMEGIGQLYTEVASSKKLEQWDWMGDVPDFEEWKNDRKLAGLEAFALAVLNKKWSSGIRIKNDDFKDDALGLIPPQIAQMAVRARLHRFTMMVKLLQNGFDGVTYPDVGNGLAYDGAFFFSAAHRGGTTGANGNNKTVNALTSANLATATQMLRQQRTYDGLLPYGAHGTALIVGPQNEATAEKLMTSDYLANAAGTATETNYQKNKFKIIVADQIDLVHSLDWFLADLSGPIKPLLFQMREEVSTSAMANDQGNNASLPTFSYDELWFGAQARYNAAYFEFRKIIGNRSN